MRKAANGEGLSQLQQATGWPLGGSLHRRGLLAVRNSLVHLKGAWIQVARGTIAASVCRLSSPSRSHSHWPDSGH